MALGIGLSYRFLKPDVLYISLFLFFPFAFSSLIDMVLLYPEPQTAISIQYFMPRWTGFPFFLYYSPTTPFPSPHISSSVVYFTSNNIPLQCQ